MRPQKGQELLDVQRIVKAAWRIVDSEGLESLSTRRLADVLGVSSPALYHHVASMQVLYGLMTEYVLRDAMPTYRRDQRWQDWFRSNAIRHRDAFLAHRDSGKVASLSIPSTKMNSELLPTLAAPLIAAGISPRNALAAQGALGSLLLGSLLYEQHEEHRKILEGVLPVGEAFMYGVEAIIEGTAKTTGPRAEAKLKKRVKPGRKPR